MVRILAATDFSEEGKPVLDFTADMVKRCGGKMYLLHAVEPCMMDAAGCMAADDMLGGFSTMAPMECADQTTTVLAMADKRAHLLADQISKEWDIPIYGKAEEADDIVVTNTIGNKAIVYQHDVAVTAGQTVNFGLELANPTEKLGVFVFTSAEGPDANCTYYQALDPWSDVKDFNITFKTSGTYFKIAVFLKDASGSNYNGGEDILKTTGMTIKNLTF
jgi:hypothetical protein